MAKASDIEDGFGDVTQDEPIYLNILSGFNRKNKIIKSLKANSLKYQKSLCEKCNTNISRPYDMAWADFVKWSLGRNPPLRVEDVICAQHIFPNDAETSMLRVYLYLLKAFGCMANVAFDGAGWDLDWMELAILEFLFALVFFPRGRIGLAQLIRGYLLIALIGSWMWCGGFTV
jgi:hypothetical protein